MKATAESGSSPLARGTRGGKRYWILRRGLIPARAGNTEEHEYPNDSFWAHPRSRGEHRVVVIAEPNDSGSSPLARGTLSVGERHVRFAGLIPARAGNTGGFVMSAAGLWAHPRSRGEHLAGVGLGALLMGSSPLARGTQVSLPNFLEQFGLIPARAGNTILRLTSGSTERAHPRSRGEHATSTGSESTAAGSSPLARGTHATALQFGSSAGLIPARAGNTMAISRVRVFLGAHPRSRGEHHDSVSFRFGVRGSSPLARGTLEDPRPGAEGPGLIPARAGNTAWTGAPEPPAGAHPRSRGEHSGG